MQTLTMGNSAKLYCLNWIEQRLLGIAGNLKILDLGCGTAAGFVSLLQRYPQAHYTGVEPSKAACVLAEHNLKGLNARIINTDGYQVYQKLGAKFDIIVSFSTLEHVYRREAYLRSVKECLVADGYCLINYDAGHFFPRHQVNAPPFFAQRERLKTLIGPVLARLGVERYYQAFVKEEEFLNLVDLVGLKPIEAKFFNSALKGVYKTVPEADREAFMQKWLDLELWLNERGIEYSDRKACVFPTRNFVLVHK